MAGSTRTITNTVMRYDRGENSDNIKVLSHTNWQTGDTIVIAPSRFNPLEAEMRTITRIRDSDGAIFLNQR